MMNKKNIIIISFIVIVIIGITAVTLALLPSGKTVKIECYDSNMQISKSIKVNKRKQVKELDKICSNISLEQDDISPYLGIKSDVKVEFEDGKFFVLQLDLSEYCYYKNANEGIESTIKMPDGLLEYVNKLIEE